MQLNPKSIQIAGVATATIVALGFAVASAEKVEPKSQKVAARVTPGPAAIETEAEPTPTPTPSVAPTPKPAPTSDSSDDDNDDDNASDDAREAREEWLRELRERRDEQRERVEENREKWENGLKKWHQQRQELRVDYGKNNGNHFGQYR